MQLERKHEPLGWVRVGPQMDIDVPQHASMRLAQRLREARRPGGVADVDHVMHRGVNRDDIQRCGIRRQVPEPSRLLADHRQDRLEDVG